MNPTFIASAPLPVGLPIVVLCLDGPEVRRNWFGGLAGWFHHISGFLRFHLHCFVEGLFGHPEGIDRGGHSTVENHLGNDFADLLFGYPDVESTLDVPADELRAVAQHGERGDGAETAGLKVDRRAVVNLSVDYGVNQFHDFGRQFGHGRRRPRTAIKAVVTASEVGRCFAQVLGATVPSQSSLLTIRAIACGNYNIGSWLKLRSQASPACRSFRSLNEITGATYWPDMDSAKIG